jgi:hypothetical protein
MADYRLAVSMISRSAGRSATAAAAYRSASVIPDERTGEVHDYTRKGGVEWTGIAAPHGAPSWTQDRVKLWNAVEAAETRKNSQVAREIQLSLPHELNFEQRRALVVEFVQKEFVARGMIADIAMHKPDSRGDQRNFHVHIMLTVRGLDETKSNGFARTKNREWNTTEALEGWRASWAQIQNQRLRQHLGHDAPHVDHRSYAERDIDKVPGRHLGPDATGMERRGADSDKGAYNRSIAARNDRIKDARRRQKEIEVRTEKKLPQGLDLVQNRANLERSEQILALSSARFVLKQITAQQKAMPGLKELNAALRREVLTDTQCALRNAWRDLHAVQRALTHFEERIKTTHVKARSLTGWITNPRRMLWLKRIEIGQRNEILKDLNDRAKAVLRLQKEIALRQEWLNSEQGKTWKDKKTRPVRELRTAERKARRNIAQAKHAVARAERLAVLVHQLRKLPLACSNFAVEISVDPIDRAKAFREICWRTDQYVSGLPQETQLELTKAVQQDLSKERAPGGRKSGR